MQRVPPPLRSRLLANANLSEGDVSVLESCMDRSEAYATLERVVLEDLRFDLPVVGTPIAGGEPTVIQEEARALALAARRLLDMSAPILELSHALEAHGHYVFRPALSETVRGVFFFAGDVPPLFIVNARLTAGAARHTLAHLYGHFLADTDPYEPTVCVMPGAELREGSAERERRADLFADELLMPEGLLEQIAGQGDVDANAVATYLDLPLSLVSERLLSLGYPVEATDSGDVWAEHVREETQPERLVHLVLEGIHEGKLDVEDVAEALGVTEAEAVDFLRLSASSGDVGPAPS